MVLMWGGSLVLIWGTDTCQRGWRAGGAGELESLHSLQSSPMLAIDLFPPLRVASRVGAVLKRK